MSSGYVIADDPRPSSLAHLSVNPVWPLFGVMFVGPWLSWPWYILNSYAIGSPNKRRELLLALGGIIGGYMLVLLSITFVREMWPESELKPFIPYIKLLMTVWKLAITYLLFTTQSQCFEIYEHYDGIVRNGMAVVAVAFLFGDRLADPIFDLAPMLRLVLG